MSLAISTYGKEAICQMNSDQLYQEHIDTMFGTKDMYDFKDEEIECTFANLLQCMPNGGKLYKYRKISDQDSFDRVYNSLSEGTLWSSRADQFTDKTDCTVYYEPVEEAERISNLIIENPELIVGAIMRSLSFEVLKENPDFDKSMLLRMVHCFNKTTGKLIQRKALKVFRDYGFDKQRSLIAISAIQRNISTALKDKKEIIEQIVHNFLNFNQEIRSRAFICSLCEDYKVKTMWEHYADNQGICIEYDFNKIKGMSTEIKRFFCSTYKVNYVDEYEKVTFVPLVKEYLEGNHEKSNDTNMNKKILNSQITKTTDYSYEKEWRIFHFNLNNQEKGYVIRADIVSAIIFDQNAIYSENGKKLLALAKKKNWGIKVRSLNSTSTKYLFKELESEA